MTKELTYTIISNNEDDYSEIHTCLEAPLAPITKLTITGLTTLCSIILQAYRETLNKSKKVGLNSWFTIITENLPQNLLLSPNEMKLNDKNIQIDISKGFYVLYYSFQTREFKINSGER